MQLRRPEPEVDFDSALALVQACDRAVYGDSDWTAAELRGDWEELDLGVFVVDHALGVERGGDGEKSDAV